MKLNFLYQKNRNGGGIQTKDLPHLENENLKICWIFHTKNQITYSLIFYLIHRMSPVPDTWDQFPPTSGIEGLWEGKGYLRLCNPRAKVDSNEPVYIYTHMFVCFVVIGFLSDLNDFLFFIAKIYFLTLNAYIYPGCGS